MYSLFCQGRRREMDRNAVEDSGCGQDQERPYVHKASASVLRDFLTQHRIDDPWVDRYLGYLKGELATGGSARV